MKGSGISQPVDTSFAAQALIPGIGSNLAEKETAIPSLGMRLDLTCCSLAFWSPSKVNGAWKIVSIP